MPINFDLQLLKDENNCEIYLETGLYDSNTEISCKKALNTNFEKIYSIEIRKDFIELGTKNFINYINKNRLILINDDSANLANYLNNDDFNKKTLFFLDAHVDNSMISNYKFKCPLFEELKAISNLTRKDNVICIDDVRILKEPFPWNESSFGSINFIDIIIQCILNINKDYKFKFLNGHIENDVLVAYV